MKECKNHVELIGYLGSDADVKTTATGKKLARLNVATSELYQNSQGEWVEATEWHQVVAWARLAEKAEKDFLKGAKVVVEGKLVHRSYTDANGVQKYITEVNATSLNLAADPAKTEAKA
ncbi:single-stranded DNA-binding protein [Flavihumibacter rivuli]|uniref:single-stranded DNA-binding protein n=1 Tax=Flavihumibacter rivuli TaxID=2838156 RepID=UPI001BDE21BB|nr:single-stranded DNA-binding protein [Flavihumibacter rivuli]ULQ55684.1 single-stranded DNA-binding protein [Flavihumibacter rivuli]